MDVIRKRFFVAGKSSPALDAHAPYLKPAYKLLDEVRRQMPDGIEQYQRQVTTEDGAILTAIRRHGQAEIHINLPAGLVEPPKPGAYCVWEGDTEQYAQILDWRLSSAVMDATGTYLYARGDDEEIPNDSVLHPERGQGVGTIYAFDAKTMEPIGSFKHDSTGDSDICEVYCDTLNNVFAAPFSPGDGIRHAVAYWAPGDLAYQSFTVSDSQVYALNNGGQFSTAGGYFWTISQRELRPGEQATVPWYLDVYDARTLARVAEMQMATNFNGTSIVASPAIGVVVAWWDALSDVISFSHLIEGTAEIALPASLSTGSGVVNFAFVMDNAGQTAWLSMGEAVNATDADYTMKLYRYRASTGWKQLEVEGLDVPWDFRLGNGIAFVAGKAVVHDPETDAVAFLMPDASAVHVFNAKDCFGDQLPPFKVKLTPPNHVYQSRATQLHRGILVFETSSESYFYPRYTTIGKAKLGRLFQHKIETP